MGLFREGEFNVYGSVHLKNILMYVQQDATLHSLFYLKTALHVSSCTTTHHQEPKQLYVQHLVLSQRYCYQMLYIQLFALLIMGVGTT
jgi:hypothetical protein